MGRIKKKEEEKMKKFSNRKVKLHCNSTNPQNFHKHHLLFCHVMHLPTSGSVAWTLVNKALVAVFS